MRNRESELASRGGGDELSLEELLVCLQDGSLFEKGDALFRIAKRGISSEEVLGAVTDQTREPQGRGRLIGTVTLANLAVAVLNWLGSEESLSRYEQIMITLDDVQRGDIERLVKDYRAEIEAGRQTA